MGPSACVTSPGGTERRPGKSPQGSFGPTEQTRRTSTIASSGHVSQHTCYTPAFKIHQPIQHQLERSFSPASSVTLIPTAYLSHKSVYDAQSMQGRHISCSWHSHRRGREPRSRLRKPEKRKRLNKESPSRTDIRSRRSKWQHLIGKNCSMAHG
jgi:IS30 family transposase